MVEEHIGGHVAQGTAKQGVHLQLVDQRDGLIVKLKPAVVVSYEADVVSELETFS